MIPIKSIAAPLLVMGLGIATASASTTIVPPPPSTNFFNPWVADGTKASIDGKLSMTQYYFDDGTWQEYASIGYSFTTTDPSLQVHSIWISFFWFDGLGYDDPSNINAQGSILASVNDVVSKADWVGGTEQFEAWFGTDDNYAMQVVSSSKGALSSDFFAPQDPFLAEPSVTRNGQLATEFVALGAGGQVLSGSLIPEPSTALLGLLGSLALLRRRR